MMPTSVQSVRNMFFFFPFESGNRFYQRLLENNEIREAALLETLDIGNLITDDKGYPRFDEAWRDLQYRAHAADGNMSLNNSALIDYHTYLSKYLSPTKKDIALCFERIMQPEYMI